MQLRALGIMSGSSLDGLDIACCQFRQDENGWKYSFEATDTVDFPPKLQSLLINLNKASAFEMVQAESLFSSWMAESILAFISSNDLKDIDFIASHGHTVFHFPENSISKQIGNGGLLSAMTGLPVICDFRTADIAAGGQGTPMVAVTDRHLFTSYSGLINLGGIGNVTIRSEEGWHSFDVCVVNQVLNKLAGLKGMTFDKDGSLAKKGNVQEKLLEELNSLDYYKKPIPKSLDNSFSRDFIFPIIDKYEYSAEDLLATYCHHVAFQFTAHISKYTLQNGDGFLISGGGAYNDYLVKVLSSIPYNITVPSAALINFKEALAVAFSGLLRWTGQVNFIGDVSGADYDTCGGAIYNANPKSKRK